MESTVNQRIKFIRETLGMAQKEFAASLEMTQAAISKVEVSDSYSVAMVNKIVEKHKVNKKWLLTGDGNMFDSIPVNSEIQLSGWRDEAYELMKEQLREKDRTIERLLEILGGKLAPGKAVANFNDPTGEPNNLVELYPVEVAA